MSLPWILTLGAFLFSVGVYGVLARRNAVLILMSIELMLNSVNINFIAFNAWLQDTALTGQIFSLFVIAIAAAEVGVGLAIVLLVFRNKKTINVDELDAMRW
jgi:NADH-quinone oxidoreductase subunit K